MYGAVKVLGVSPIAAIGPVVASPRFSSRSCNKSPSETLWNTRLALTKLFNDFLAGPANAALNLAGFPSDPRPWGTGSPWKSWSPFY